MPFEKGQDKIGGRAKGVENKDKKKIREFIGMYLDENTKKLEDELGKLEGKDYINAITGLLEYSIPKLNRTEIKDDRDINPTVNITTDNPEVVNKLIDKLDEE